MHSRVLIGPTNFWIFFYNFHLCPPGVSKIVTKLLQHCLGRKGGHSSSLLELNYKMSVYYVKYRVVNHPLREEESTTFAIHCRSITTPSCRRSLSIIGDPRVSIGYPTSLLVPILTPEWLFLAFTAIVVFHQTPEVKICFARYSEIVRLDYSILAV